MYDLILSDDFKERYEKLTKKDISLKKKVVKVLNFLSDNPRLGVLHTHKVGTKKYGKRWSSKVTGDLRVIWDYDENENLVLLLLTIGGHSGKHGVYK